MLSQPVDIERQRHHSSECTVATNDRIGQVDSPLPGQSSDRVVANRKIARVACHLEMRAVGVVYRTLRDALRAAHDGSALIEDAYLQAAAVPFLKLRQVG